MKKSSLRIICDRNFKTKALFSGLTTKNGNKALFILRNRAHSFVPKNWARWPITGPTNEASIFVLLWRKHRGAVDSSTREN